jgi:hypothetical protein
MGGMRSTTVLLSHSLIGWYSMTISSRLSTRDHAAFSCMIVLDILIHMSMYLSVGICGSDSWR